MIQKFSLEEDEDGILKPGDMVRKCFVFSDENRIGLVIKIEKYWENFPFMCLVKWLPDNVAQIMQTTLLEKINGKKKEKY